MKLRKVATHIFTRKVLHGRCFPVSIAKYFKIVLLQKNRTEQLFYKTHPNDCF